MAARGGEVAAEGGLRGCMAEVSCSEAAVSARAPSRGRGAWLGHARCSWRGSCTGVGRAGGAEGQVAAQLRSLQAAATRTSGTTRLKIKNFKAGTGGRSVELRPLLCAPSTGISYSYVVDCPIPSVRLMSM